MRTNLQLFAKIIGCTCVRCFSRTSRRPARKTNPVVLAPITKLFIGRKLCQRTLKLVRWGLLQFFPRTIFGSNRFLPCRSWFDSGRFCSLVGQVPGAGSQGGRREHPPPWEQRVSTFQLFPLLVRCLVTCTTCLPICIWQCKIPLTDRAE